jgi:hypothetical protein
MMYTEDTCRNLWSKLVRDHINCAMNHPNIFVWNDQGKPHIPHLAGSSQHLESNLGPNEYKAGMLSNELWCLGTWWWEIQQRMNTITYNYQKNKHKAKQIYDTHIWNKFYLVTSCIVVYNVAEEKTNITLVLSQPVPSPASPLWLYSTTTVTIQRNHCDYTAQSLYSITTTWTVTTNTTWTNHKFFCRSNSHLIYYTHIQSVREFRYCELCV